MQKPSIPKGTRDFGPEEMSGREFIFNALRTVFKQYGFQPIETPAMEQLSVLTGKYGEEGDRLIFKILNSGDYLKKAGHLDVSHPDAARELLPLIAEKALRYDLTVPFARYVVMNQHKLNFPFKRYQIQPVWRADRPQKGRYREFYQCDVDIIGSDGILNEFELVRICDAGFDALKLEQVTLRLNNRKILEGMAHHFGAGDRFIEFVTILDKLDKLGYDKVMDELAEKGFSVPRQALQDLKNAGSGSALDMLEAQVAPLVSDDNPKAAAGYAEMKELLTYVSKLNLKSIRVEYDLFLARGLTYYTGAIFEAVTTDFPGSILGGGRYDDLTGVFGLPGTSGVGISFGADRIYDVLESRGVLQNLQSQEVRVLLINFGGAAAEKSLELAIELQEMGVASELYPDDVKPKKQFKYADQDRFSHVIVIGDQELAEGVCNLKELKTRDEERLSFTEAKAKLARLTKHH